VTVTDGLAHLAAAPTIVVRVIAFASEPRRIGGGSVAFLLLADEVIE
jgi:hypothetical protein